MSPISLRRCAALIAAYALALQAVLAAFAYSAPVVAEPGFVICRGDAAGTPDQPQHHDQCGACLAGHCAGVAAGPDRLAIAILWPIASGPTETPAAAIAFAPSAPRTQPNPPRAPPAG